MHATHNLFLRLLGAVSLLLSGFGHAQETGLLYDPDPPADSAYVRVIVAATGAPVDISVDERVRVRALPWGQASDYLVLPAGERTLMLGDGKGGVLVKTTVNAPKGRAVTLAFTARSKEARPLVFEDKANTNKLKAVFTAYHLLPAAPAYDVVAGDKAQTVFAALAPGKSASRQVNPLSIDFGIASGGTRLASAPLTMEFGGTYSLFILPGDGGKPQVRAALNSVERYTGK